MSMDQANRSSCCTQEPAAEAGAMEEEDEDGGRLTRARWWIQAARYLASALVLLLAPAVFAGALVVSTRPEMLFHISVANGYVSVSAITSMSPNVSLSLTFKAFNPSGRAGVQYSDIYVSLLDSSNPSVVIASFPTGDISMAPAEGFELFVEVEVPAAYVKVDTTTVYLNGTLKTLLTALRPLTYKHVHAARYICSQVTVRNSTQRQAAGATDVPCTG